MPTYEYRCDEGHEFESKQGIKDDPLAKCEYEVADDRKGPVFCDAPCHRLISKSSFVLKGAGWSGKGGA